MKKSKKLILSRRDIFLVLGFLILEALKSSKMIVIFFEFNEELIPFVFCEHYRRICRRKVQKLKLSRRDAFVFVFVVFVALNE